MSNKKHVLTLYYNDTVVQKRIHIPTVPKKKSIIMRFINKCKGVFKEVP